MNFQDRSLNLAHHIIQMLGVSKICVSSVGTYVYSTMHRKANEVFAILHERLSCAGSRKCHLCVSFCTNVVPYKRM